jgi:hypothetical protein
LVAIFDMYFIEKVLVVKPSADEVMVSTVLLRHWEGRGMRTSGRRLFSDQRATTLRSALLHILPVNPFDGMLREITIHRFAEGREEGLFA